ncbi:AraC family transcriptional regulator [Flavivirga spongiicola]|uniref:AraC family transcriptional regulator n=1 Tax=Flavivirga spongiicola TaxID=421621 RepID=A0ABU7XMG2_9FLAO|nr:AraC family transcriptional regulator [Flavivirga sp. MEBiC05379]MDO5981420.1 AraC family transcriptional regulator [Flavivirga sp. MEBiC05379]
MKKKRRDTENYELIDLIALKTSLKEHISEEIHKIEEEGLTKIERHIVPKYGKGMIIEFHFNNVVISISRYRLNHDFKIYNQGEKNKLQLSFLLEGEKIIGLNNTIEELLYESQECYTAYIKTYAGYNKISGGKPFKEIKITLSESFLRQHGISKEIEFKKLTDNNLIIPITNDLFSVLSDLETKKIKGISRKIYLEAKVLEILAIQINNYKNINIDGLSVQHNKHLKKLYNLKQFLKNNLDKNYSMNQLVKQVGLNESVLRSEFKRVFESTISKYFVEEKMIRAKYLLENTELPIYEIAESVGYKNATHFSAAFKRFYNERPKEFRVKI